MPETDCWKRSPAQQVALSYQQHAGKFRSYCASRSCWHMHSAVPHVRAAVLELPTSEAWKPSGQHLPLFTLSATAAPASSIVTMRSRTIVDPLVLESILVVVSVSASGWLRPTSVSKSSGVEQRASERAIDHGHHRYKWKYWWYLASLVWFILSLYMSPPKPASSVDSCILQSLAYTPPNAKSCSCVPRSTIPPV